MSKAPMPRIALKQPVSATDEAAMRTAAETEIKSYSITPRTHTERVLLNNGTDCFTIVDTFEYKTNKVLRFGINVLDQQVCVANGQMLSEVVTVAPSSPASGSRTASSSKYGPAEAKQVAMHRLEKTVLESAVQHLTCSVDKVVLVDVFERTQGLLKVDAQNKPSVHTVVLYKDPAQTTGAVAAAPTTPTKILVIDPSNFMFSCHLANHNPQLLAFGAEVGVQYKSVQIYKPLTKIGFEPADSRDCIDIATKLAFILARSNVPLDLDTISTHPAVVAVSNIRAIDRCIPDEKDNPRIKQSSSPEVVEVFNQIERLAFKWAKIAIAADERLGTKFLNDYSDVFTRHLDYDATIAALNTLCLYFPGELDRLLTGEYAPVDAAVGALPPY